MKDTYYQNDTQFDKLFQVIEKPLPSSGMLDPQYFLSVNEGAIRYRLSESGRDQKRMAYTRFSVAFGIFTAIAMLFTFSREARAFARDVFYTVIEWFSPQQNESGVTFDIEDETDHSIPDTETGQSDEKISFKDIGEADKLYSRSIFVLNDAAFILSDGFVLNDTICINYQADNARIQIIAEPIQSSGSVVYHFNDASFDKIDIFSLGTLYYKLSGDAFFGGIMTNDTNVIIRIPDHATSGLLDRIVRSISRYR